MLSSLSLWPSTEPVLVRAGSLILREWANEDVPALVELFDTPEMNRRTPLPSPFDVEAARDYVESAHDMRRRLGALQLAVTEDGIAALGEVIICPTDVAGRVELAYGVGAAHAGRGLARRAVAVALELARDGGAVAARLHIAIDNPASQRVAEVTGFDRLDEPLVERRRKGQVLHLAVWQRAL